MIAELYISNYKNYYISNYRFGFNGQEKDQEIYNNQSTTTATFWEYDGRIGRRWNVDPEFKKMPEQSQYACFGNNPIYYNDPLGDLKWHPDTRGNIIADKGDNEFTLQNYIYSNSSSTITVTQAKDLLKSMGTPISDITGHRILLSNVRKITGSHIATMLNPGTKYVHQGQNDFIESKPVQIGLTTMSFVMPLARLGSIVKATQNAYTTLKQLALVAEVMGVIVPSLYKATDNVLGNGDVKSSTFPGLFLENSGYPRTAGAVDAAISGAGIIKNGASGFTNPVEAVYDVNDFVEGAKKSIQPKKENTGYEKK